MKSTGLIAGICKRHTLQLLTPSVYIQFAVSAKLFIRYACAIWCPRNEQYIYMNWCPWFCCTVHRMLFFPAITNYITKTYQVRLHTRDHPSAHACGIHASRPLQAHEGERNRVTKSRMRMWGWVAGAGGIRK